MQPHRAPLKAISSLGISFIVTLLLDLPYALLLLHLVRLGDPVLTKELRIDECVCGDQSEYTRHTSAQEVTEEQYKAFESALAEIIFAPDHFAALKLKKSATLSDADVNKAVKKAKHRAHPDRNLKKQDSFTVKQWRESSMRLLLRLCLSTADPAAF